MFNFDLSFLFWTSYTLLVVGTVLYSYLVATFDYFKDQKIVGPKPNIIFGTWWGNWNWTLSDLEVYRYRKYGKIYGVFDGRRPNVVIADQELLKMVLIKDFDHFTNRRVMLTKSKLVSKNLLMLRDDEWKDARLSVSSTFLKNENMKQISKIMNKACIKLANDLAKYADGKKEVNFKAEMTPFLMSLISYCGFGTTLKTVLEKPSPNFISVATKFVFPNNATGMFTTLSILYPKFGQIFKRLLSSSNTFDDINIFAKLTKKILEAKRANKQNKKEDNENPEADLLDLLLQAAEDPTAKEYSKSVGCPFNNQLTNDNFLISQLLFLVLSGFDKITTVVSLAIHCIAMKPQVQDKLRKEIKRSQEIRDDEDESIIDTIEIGYDTITVQNMPYLEQCVLETLRLYPPVIRAERICNQPAVYKRVKINKGCMVTIPILAMHRDPEFYENPLSFIPERFAEAHNKIPLTFLPFGVGKRNCVGMRIAMQCVKLTLCHLLNTYKFYPIDKTVHPPQFRKGTIELLQTQQLWLGIERISENTLDT